MDYTSYSGTISAAGVAQSLVPAGVIQHGLTFQNQGSVPMYLCWTGSASASNTSLRVDPGVTWEAPRDMFLQPSPAISLFCSAAGAAFFCVGR